jgi:hypothetical protein
MTTDLPNSMALRLWNSAACLCEEDFRWLRISVASAGQFPTQKIDIDRYRIEHPAGKGGLCAVNTPDETDNKNF